MAQASEDSNIEVLKLEDKEVRIENDPQNIIGWRIDQILTSDLFDLPNARSISIENLQNERARLVDLGKTSDTKCPRLKEIDQKLSELPLEDNVENQRVMNILKKYASLIEASEANDD